MGDREGQPLCHNTLITCPVMQWGDWGEGGSTTIRTGRWEVAESGIVGRPNGILKVTQRRHAHKMTPFLKVLTLCKMHNV